MTSNVDNLRHFLPLKPLDYQVLHGYGIVQAAQAQFPDQPSLELGSL